MPAPLLAALGALRVGAGLVTVLTDPEVRAEIAAQVPAVDAVEKCFARRMGYHLFVDMHVHVDPLMTVRDSHTLAHLVKDTIREQMPHVYDVLIHIEPSGPPYPRRALVPSTTPAHRH